MHHPKPENMEYIRITGLDNAFEAQLMESILSQSGIPHRIRSHHDTAYDGLYQMQKGWGDLMAPESFRTQIMTILRQIREESETTDH